MTHSIETYESGIIRLHFYCDETWLNFSREGDLFFIGAEIIQISLPLKDIPYIELEKQYEENIYFYFIPNYLLKT